MFVLETHINIMFAGKFHDDLTCRPRWNIDAGIILLNISSLALTTSHQQTSGNVFLLAFLF
jgi:hypothetical protein